MHKSKKGSQKFAFLEALFVAALIFGLGFLAGIWLESYRVNQIDYLSIASEVDLFDLKSQEQFLDILDCEDSISGLIDFADRIYEEAKLMEKYDGASRLTDEMILRHRKYDLLRASLFMSAVKVKQKCNESFDIITYMYEYQTEDIDTKAKQGIFSNALIELKNKQVDKIILIPLAGDNNLISVDSIKSQYNITQLPTILINEDIIITEAEQLKDLNNLLSDNPINYTNVMRLN